MTVSMRIPCSNNDASDALTVNVNGEHATVDVVGTGPIALTRETARTLVDCLQEYAYPGTEMFGELLESGPPGLSRTEALEAAVAHVGADGKLRDVLRVARFLVGEDSS